MESNNTESQNIFLHSKVVKNFDYSLRGNYIAFLNPVTDKINVMHINMSEESEIMEKIDSIVINNTGKPKCLTIDWIHDLLYWIDIKLNTINVVNIRKPEMNLMLIDLNEDDVTSLVVNPLKSVLIWNKNGISPKIMQSFQDGSNQRVLYGSGSRSRSATHITVDFESERYYFIDKTYWSLYSIDFQGSDEMLHIRENFFSIVNDMSVLNDDLYLSIDEALVRLPKISLSQKKIDFILISSKFNDSENLLNTSSISQKSFRPEIYRVKIVDPLLQPNFTNKCESTNCSYLCLPSGNIVGFRCVCPTNSSLNLTDCEIHEQNLIVQTTTERITFRTQRIETVMTTYRSFITRVIITTQRTTERSTQRTDTLIDRNTIRHQGIFRHEESEEEVKNRRQLNFQSLGINNEKNPLTYSTHNIPLMFCLLLIGFFVFSLVMTALIIFNFRFNVFSFSF